VKRLAVIAWCALAICALSFSPALCATIDDVSPQMRKDALCMTDALRTVSGIKDVKLGTSDRGNWAHLYIEYQSPQDKDGATSMLHFEAERACSTPPNGSCCSSDGRNYCFMLLLSGLSAIGSEPNDWGTPAVATMWKAKCGLTPFILFG
jgi:hypothetical protein